MYMYVRAARRMVDKRGGNLAGRICLPPPSRPLLLMLLLLLLLLRLRLRLRLLPI
jgi:hypothetical protein